MIGYYVIQEDEDEDELEHRPLLEGERVVWVEETTDSESESEGMSEGMSEVDEERGRTRGFGALVRRGLGIMRI